MSSWPKKHEVLLHYSGGMKPTFHPQKQRIYYQKRFRHTQIDDDGNHYADVYVRDVWDRRSRDEGTHQSSQRTHRVANAKTARPPASDHQSLNK